MIVIHICSHGTDEAFSRALLIKSTLPDDPIELISSYFSTMILKETFTRCQFVTFWPNHKKYEENMFTNLLKELREHYLIGKCYHLFKISSCRQLFRKQFQALKEICNVLIPDWYCKSLHWNPSVPFFWFCPWKGFKKQLELKSSIRVEIKLDLL